MKRIFYYTDKSKDGILSEKELIASLQKGIDSGAVPEAAVPVMKQAVQDNATNKDDPSAPAVVCNLDCLQASFDQTLRQMNVQDSDRASVTEKVADTLLMHDMEKV